MTNSSRNGFNTIVPRILVRTFVVYLLYFCLFPNDFLIISEFRDSSHLDITVSRFHPFVSISLHFRIWDISVCLMMKIKTEELFFGLAYETHKDRIGSYNRNLSRSSRNTIESSCCTYSRFQRIMTLVFMRNLWGHSPSGKMQFHTIV